MKKLFNRTIIIILFLSIYSCGSTSSGLGGSEFGNPTRPVTGSLVSETANGGVNLAITDDCPADQIIAVDSTAQTTIAAVNVNCSFTINLVVNKAYAINFVLNDQFVASMIFNNSLDTLSSPVFIISAGDTTINLGIVTISGTIAAPETEPAEQNDQDGDGVNDFDDDDDDNDGSSDDQDEDCDLDGFTDDYDEDDDDCDVEEEGGATGGDGEDADGTIAKVLEVRPPNDDDLSAEEDFVNVNESVEVRFGCAVDTSTVNGTTFRIADAANNSVSCSFQFESNNTRVECEHDDFSPDTIYTATLTGIQCEDGTTIETATWTWRTRDN